MKLVKLICIVPPPSGNEVHVSFGRMRWPSTLFVHWRVDGEALAARLPDGLELDRLHGRAWLGLVAQREIGPAPRALLGSRFAPLLSPKRKAITTSCQAHRRD